MYSRDTCITTPCGSFPASPANATFVTACLLEDVALPSSPEVNLKAASVSIKGDPLAVSHGVAFLECCVRIFNIAYFLFPIIGSLTL